MSERKPGRNDQCPCGSGRKYKHCCLEKDEEQAREARAKAAEEAAAKAQAEPAADGAAAPKPAPLRDQDWRRGSDINTQGFRKPAGVRKIGS